MRRPGWWSSLTATLKRRVLDAVAETSWIEGYWKSYTWRYTATYFPGCVPILLLMRLGFYFCFFLCLSISRLGSKQSLSLVDKDNPRAAVWALIYSRSRWWRNSGHGHGRGCMALGYSIVLTWPSSVLEHSNHRAWLVDCWACYSNSTLIVSLAFHSSSKLSELWFLSHPRQHVHGYSN